MDSIVFAVVLFWKKLKINSSHSASLQGMFAELIKHYGYRTAWTAEKIMGILNNMGKAIVPLSSEFWIQTEKNQMRMELICLC